jgi:hypothetical protein
VSFRSRAFSASDPWPDTLKPCACSERVAYASFAFRRAAQVAFIRREISARCAAVKLRWPRRPMRPIRADATSWAIATLAALSAARRVSRS